MDVVVYEHSSIDSDVQTSDTSLIHLEKGEF